LREYKKVVKRNIEAAKGRIRRRRFIIAIDETHEPFYGRIKNLCYLENKQGYRLLRGRAANIRKIALDRGFYTWGVIKVLQKLKLGYIILVPKYDKFKEWLKKGAGLHDHQGKLNRDKTTYKISTCIAILRDGV
jgi:hypothetical protein